MRVSILQDQLARGLSIVAKAVESRPTLPVLANVLLMTEDARLKLVATNLEMSITTYVGAKIDVPGAITLPAKTFAELVNNLSSERVDLILDAQTQTVNVRCGTTKSNIKGIAASEFPPIPETKGASVQLPSGVFKQMITQTVFAAAKEDSRPVLGGIYTQFGNNALTMTSADGYRLSVRTSQIDESAESEPMIIPARTLAEVARVITDEERPLGLSMLDEREGVAFYYESTIITSQLISGKFPDFNAIVPKTYSTSITVYADELLNQCKRAEIFARDNNFSARFIAQPPASPSEPGQLSILGRSAERGDSEGMIDAGVEGEALEVAYNIRYLIDVLNIIDSERIILETHGAAHPVVIRPESYDGLVCVIMPMSLNR